MTPGHLSIARLCFELEATETAQVPAFKGDLLRMALLWWLSEFWCVMPDRCRNGCRRPGVCTFGRLCQPLVDPAWPPQIRRLMGDTPPPAYALRDRRRCFTAGTGWRFELTLVGDAAIGQIPAIVAAVQQGAERGMGRERVRSRLRRALGARRRQVRPGGPGPGAVAPGRRGERGPVRRADRVPGGARDRLRGAGLVHRRGRRRPPAPITPGGRPSCAAGTPTRWPARPLRRGSIRVTAADRRRDTT